MDEDFKATNPKYKVVKLSQFGFSSAKGLELELNENSENGWQIDKIVELPEDDGWYLIFINWDVPELEEPGKELGW